MDREEIKVAIARWTDTYKTRFDQELTTAWPDLAERLREQITSLSIYELAVGPGQAFQKQRIEPVVERWVNRYVQPIIDDSTKDLCVILQTDIATLRHDLTLASGPGGVLDIRDVALGLALPGGLLLGGMALSASLVTTTNFLIFTTVTVLWPLLIAGLIVGSLLSWVGVINLASLPQTLRERFQNILLPAMKDALIGKGVQHKGKHVASLKDQLKQQVQDVANAARKRLA